VENEQQPCENEQLCIIDANDIMLRQIHNEQAQVETNDLLSEVDNVLLFQLENVPVQVENNTLSQFEASNSLLLEADNRPVQDYFLYHSADAEKNSTNNIITVEEVCVENIVPPCTSPNRSDVSESENEDLRDPSYVPDAPSEEESNDAGKRNDCRE
jgi:hypothetical protein